jgi:uncharacterized protein (DUF1778 family)
MAKSTQIVSVRVSADERDLLAFAAEQGRTNVSDFIRRKALEAAEQDLADHRIVTIPAENWEQVEDWVEAPAKDVPALRKLAAHRPPWQD